jgi:uncharacterized delta-60 repeat protein
LFFKKINPKITTLFLCLFTGIVLLFSYNNCGKVSVAPTGVLNLGNANNGGFSIGAGFEGVTSIVKTIELDSQNRILIGGEFDTYDRVSRSAMVRLSPDGSLDQTFDVGSGFTKLTNRPSINKIIIQTNGSILAGGTFNEYNGISINNLIRLNQDASKDNSFNYSMQSSEEIYSIQQYSDVIMISGRFPGLVKKLSLNGNVDSTFNLNLETNYEAVFDIYADGITTILGGLNLTDDPIWSKMSAAWSGIGVLGAEGAGEITTVVNQPDGKFIIAGDFTGYNVDGFNRILRYNINGIIDAGFITGEGFDGLVTDMALQSDGKIIVTGYFQSYNGNNVNRIVRLLSNGALDPSFNIGSGFDASTHAIAIQPDGKILVGGAFTQYNGDSWSGIVRLNIDGTADSP